MIITAYPRHRINYAIIKLALYTRALFSMKKNKGFSLMELLVVAGILGLLAMIAAPMYADYKYRISISRDFSQMAQVNTNIRALASANDTFPTTLTEIGFGPPNIDFSVPGRQLYEYDGDPTGFGDLSVAWVDYFYACNSADIQYDLSHSGPETNYSRYLSLVHFLMAETETGEITQECFYQYEDFTLPAPNFWIEYEDPALERMGCKRMGRADPVAYQIYQDAVGVVYNMRSLCN